MKKKSLHKAFTIVELVVVIAVIAVLSAILIPTFTNVVAQARVATATSFIKNINTVLAVNEVQAPDSKALTMYDAIDQGKVAGLDVNKQSLPYGYDFIFDGAARRFAIVTGDFDANNPDQSKVIASEGNLRGRGVDLWKRYDAMPDVQTFSIYATSRFSDAVVNDLTVGFDEGDAVLSDIYYSRPDATEGQTVTIRTFGSNLHINAPLDSVKHYEWVNELDVTAVDPDHCYEEHGYIQKISAFSAGKFLATRTARFHENATTVSTKLAGENVTTNLAGASYSVPFYLSPLYDGDNHYIADDYQDGEESPVYDEPADSMAGVDAEDLSGLHNAFASIGSNYTARVKTFLNEPGARNYYRHYKANYPQGMVEIHTDEAYYRYPTSDTYLTICNKGYLNYKGNLTAFRLPGETLEARLGCELVRANLTFAKANTSYQNEQMTLANLTSDYLSSYPFARVSENKYSCTSRTLANDLLPLIAPNFNNKGMYIVPETVTIEVNPNESTAFRLRLYLSGVNVGALVNCHREQVAKPNWYLLFGELNIDSVGSTTFEPASQLLAQ